MLQYLKLCDFDKISTVHNLFCYITKVSRRDRIAISILHIAFTNEYECVIKMSNVTN